MENEKKTIFCMKNRFFPSKILFDLIMVSISTFICSFLQSLQWFQFNMTFKNNIKYSWNNIEYLIRSQNRSSESNNIEAKNYHVHVDEHFVYFLVLYEYFVDKIHTSIRMKKKTIGETRIKWLFGNILTGISYEDIVFTRYTVKNTSKLYVSIANNLSA